MLLAQDGAPAAATGSMLEKRSRQADWNATVEIHKNGSLLASIPVSEPVAAVGYTDTEPITGTAYGEENYVLKEGAYYINHYSDNLVDPSELNTGGKDFYIIRVVGTNGRHAYIGPIWVDAASK